MVSAVPSLPTFASVFAAIVTVISVALISVTLDKQKDSRPVIDATCASDRVCTVGASVLTDAGDRLCQVWNKPTGAACTSACYANGTRTYCTNAQECTSRNATACLGYCAIDPGLVNAYFFNQPNHPDCADKFIFKDFFTWGTSLSSSFYGNWILYTDYPPECWPSAGCVGYATPIVFYSEYQSTVTPTLYDCLDYLNMSNAECVQAKSIPLDEGLANALAASVALDEVIPSPFQMKACLYTYACVVTNETAYTDPLYLLGSDRKRSVLDNSPMPNAKAYIQALVERKKDDIRAKLVPAMQRYAETHKVGNV